MQYAMDVVQRVLLAHMAVLQAERDDTQTKEDVWNILKSVFVVSLSFAWLNAFRNIYAPRDSTSFAITMDKAAFGAYIGAANDKLKERVALFPESGSEDDKSVVLTDQQVYAEFKKDLTYLSEKVFRSEALKKVGSSGLPAPYDVVSLVKKVYKLSDARCESTLLRIDDDLPSSSYRSTKNVSRRARERARKYISDSESSSSSDSD